MTNQLANTNQSPSDEIVTSNNTFIKKTADVISKNQAAVLIFAGGVSTSLVLIAIAKSISIVLVALYG
ncbi:MAG: hypothetical protein QNJ37_08385 [Crocosphaera sp.]|nr:hypothetical protein [Crocosphaera sp.]